MNNRYWLAITLTFIAPPAIAGEAGIPSAHQTRFDRFLPQPLAPFDLAPVQRDEADLAQFFGAAFGDWGFGQLSMPVSKDSWRLDSNRSFNTGTFGVRVDRPLSSRNLVSLAASYGDGFSNETERSVASGASAALSWQGRFRNESGVTGRLIIGDEESRDRIFGQFSRRFVGLELEGRYSLWRDHAPYAGFVWRKNDYQSFDNGNGLLTNGSRSESQSRLAAGWAWQIQPNWDFRAEANYRFAEDPYDPADSDRTQFYLRTRFELR